MDVLGNVDILTVSKKNNACVSYLPIGIEAEWNIVALAISGPLFDYLNERKHRI